MRKFSTGLLNKSLRIFFTNALRISLSSPSQAYSFVRTLIWQAKAARIRKKYKQQNITVPPIIIFSITDKCNLECKGCYHKALHSKSDSELSTDRVRTIVKEAQELGVSFFVVAGGEPFCRPELLEIINEYPQMIFLVFSNGVLIDDEMINRFKRQKNVVPLISLEGNEKETDSRRGEGIYNQLQETMKKMHDNKIFFGTSLTLTRQGFPVMTDLDFTRDLVENGCRFFLYLEYNPIEEGTDDWVLTSDQRTQFSDILKSYREQFPALFIGVPWDETDVGGCLASARGFIHINAQGDVEPCPFAPYSDTNVQDSSLREALQSKLLHDIRRHPEKLIEDQGGCALWYRREWVQSLLQNEQDNS